MSDYDVFFSYRSARYERDGRVRALLSAFREAGLSVWVDAEGIDYGADIPDEVVAGLSSSRLLLAYYTPDYAQSRVCQWELTCGFLAGQQEAAQRKLASSEAARRVGLTFPSGADFTQIHPVDLRSAKAAAIEDVDAVVAAMKRRLAGLDKPIGKVMRLASAKWFPSSARIQHTDFVGRIPALWQVHTQLCCGQHLVVTGKPPAAAAVHGLGGIGKTLLSAEYAERFAAAYPGGVVWLRAVTSNPKLDGGLSAKQEQLGLVATQLGLETAGKTPQQIEHATWAALLAKKQRCLVIVDDVPHGLSATQLNAWMAPAEVGHTLLTTRSRAYGRLARGLALDVLDRTSAVQLLTSKRAPQGDAEARAADAICALLGDHPLALDVASSQLLSSGAELPYAATLANLSHTRSDRLERIAQRLKDAGEVLPADHELSITKTLLTSIEKLCKADRDVLLLASLSHNAPWPGWLITKCFAAAHTTTEQSATVNAPAPTNDFDAADACDDAIMQVTTHSLAETTKGAGDLFIHALVARTMRFSDHANRRSELHAAVVATLLQELPAVVDIRNHGRLEAAVAHGRALANEDTAWGLDLLGWTARYDHQRADYYRAQQGYQTQQRGCVSLLGAEHPSTLTSMNNLASTLTAQGEVDEALALGDAALKGRAALLGARHSDTTVAAWNQLTTLLEAQRQEQAIEVLSQYLAWLIAADETTLSADQRTV